MADMIIRIDSANLQAGQVGSIDVWTQSNSSDTFSLFSFYLRIDPITEAGGALVFQDSFDSPSALKQSNSEQHDPRYIFAGKTDPLNFTATRPPLENQRYSGGDESSTGNITISSPDWYLLGRVELQHVTPSPLLSSGTYRVSLINDTGLTYFQNLDIDDLDPLQPKIHSDSFSLANSGIVTITAVPEPSSLMLISTMGVLLLWHRRRIAIVKDS